MLDGNTVVLALPSLSDTMSDVVSKTATALSVLATGLTPKIVPGQLNVNTALSMNGNALTNVGSTQLVDGNQPSAAGSMYFHLGEFYLVDSTGVVQVTSNGVLNVAGQVGIVGDYGGSNPARVSYDNTSKQYRFTQSTGVWADIVARSLILNGAGGGTATVSVDASVSSGLNVAIKSLGNGTNTSVLVYKGSTSTLEDSINNTDTKIINGPIAAGGNIVAAGTVTATGYKYSTVIGGAIPFTGGAGSSVNPTAFGVPASSVGWNWISGLIPVRSGERLKQINTRYSVKAAGTYIVSVLRVLAGGSTSAVETWNDSVAGPNHVDQHIMSSPYTALIDDRLHVKVQAPGGVGATDLIDQSYAGWDLP